MGSDGGDFLSNATDSLTNLNTGATNFFTKTNSELANAGRGISNGQYSSNLNQFGVGVGNFLNSAWKYISGASYEEKQDNERKALHEASVNRANALQAEQDRAAGLDRNASITADASRNSAAAAAGAAAGGPSGGGTPSGNLGGASNGGTSANEKDFLGI